MIFLDNNEKDSLEDFAQGRESNIYTYGCDYDKYYLNTKNAYSGYLFKIYTQDRLLSYLSEDEYNEYLTMKEYVVSFLSCYDDFKYTLLPRDCVYTKAGFEGLVIKRFTDAISLEALLYLLKESLDLDTIVIILKQLILGIETELKAEGINTFDLHTGNILFKRETNEIKIIEADSFDIFGKGASKQIFNAIRKERDLPDAYPELGHEYDILGFYDVFFELISRKQFRTEKRKRTIDTLEEEKYPSFIIDAYLNLQFPCNDALDKFVRDYKLVRINNKSYKLKKK